MIIVHMNRSTTNVFEAVKKSSQQCFIGFVFARFSNIRTNTFDTILSVMYIMHSEKNPGTNFENRASVHLPHLTVSFSIALQAFSRPAFSLLVVANR